MSDIENIVDPEVELEIVPEVELEIVPLEKIKKPLSEARKRSLAKANATRKRNAAVRKQKRDDENAKRYLEKMAREEEFENAKRINDDAIEEVEEVVEYRKKQKTRPKKRKVKKVVYISSSESDSDESDSYIERRIKPTPVYSEPIQEQPIVRESYKLNFA